MRSMKNDFFTYEVEISSKLIDEYLPNVLNAFPCSSIVDRFKRSLYSLPIHLTVGRCQSEHRKKIDKTKFFPQTQPNVRFNFVILNDRLIFARIPLTKELSTYLSTKHISLANESTNVRFAGEFWLDEFGRWRINNNSGTYRPADVLRKCVVELIRYLNPSLNIKIGSRYSRNQQTSSRTSFHLFIKKTSICDQFFPFVSYKTAAGRTLIIE